uniref:Uncharacterized protein n=1 Tax=Vespula pensylvanica TaxID=30213 RepID=A0A834UEC4_VESPE|nr:hypothetical protein H0235_002461 [Vespula pensylvanica]
MAKPTEFRGKVGVENARVNMDGGTMRRTWSMKRRLQRPKVLNDPSLRGVTKLSGIDRQKEGSALVVGSKSRNSRNNALLRIRRVDSKEYGLHLHAADSTSTSNKSVAPIETPIT